MGNARRTRRQLRAAAGRSRSGHCYVMADITTGEPVVILTDPSDWCPLCAAGEHDADQAVTEW